jgi:fucose permease
MTAHARRLTPGGVFNAVVLLVYGAGLLQGLMLVSVPALSTALKHTLALSDGRYGSLFLPQVLCTTLAALAGGALAKRLPLKRLLLAALLANASAQLALAASAGVAPQWTYLILLAATALLGLGFGLSSAPLNAFPVLLFPTRRDTAVVAVHTALGIGLAIGPLIAAPFLMHGSWWFFPLLLSLVTAALAVVLAVTRVREPATAPAIAGAATAARRARYRTVAPFALIAILYAFAEGTFSNWVVIYLQEDRAMPATVATAALSMFWAALATGRLAAAALVVRVQPVKVWLTLPVLMIAVLCALPGVRGSAGALLAYGMAGLACSAFFPLTISHAVQRLPADTAWVSSVLVAALMTGVGVGTYLIAPLREFVTLATLFRYSAIYPFLAAVLMLAVIGAGLRQRRVDEEAGRRANAAA